MSNLKTRLDKAEAEARRKSKKRGTWQIALLENPTPAQLAEAEAEARANGWEPDAGIWCIEVYTTS